MFYTFYDRWFNYEILTSLLGLVLFEFGGFQIVAQGKFVRRFNCIDATFKHSIGKYEKQAYQYFFFSSWQSAKLNFLSLFGFSSFTNVFVRKRVR